MVDPEALMQFRRTWCLGSEGFRKEQLERMEGKLGECHAGELRRESAEAKAERLIGEELARRRWTAEDLKALRRSDPDELAIGVRLRRATTLTIKAIAARLPLGTGNTARANLHRLMAEQDGQAKQA